MKIKPTEGNVVIKVGGIEQKKSSVLRPGSSTDADNQGIVIDGGEYFSNGARVVFSSQHVHEEVIVDGEKFLVVETKHIKGIIE